MEDQIQLIGRRLIKKLTHRSINPKKRFFERMLQISMQEDEVRGALLRFVDLLPALKRDADVLRLLSEHTAPVWGRLPARVKLAVKLVLNPVLPKRIGAALVRWGVEQFAKQFIAATNFDQAATVTRCLKQRGADVTFDILGELVTSDRLGEVYRDHLCGLMTSLHKNGVTDINIAIKFSAFDSQLNPADWEGSIQKIKTSFEKVLKVAEKTGAFIWVDPEKYEHLDLTMEVFFRTLRRDGDFGKTDKVGIGLQAYLKDSDQRAGRLIQWAQERGVPVGVRLIKGAYWDYEVMHAGQMGWPIPVFTEKWQSDEQFEHLTDLLVENAKHLFIAFGTHNARSVAYAIAKAGGLGSTKWIEFQTLYGMASRLEKGILAEGFRLRVYTPFTVDNQYIPGMAYLGRRILENTSQESFLRQASGRQTNPEELLKRPSEIKKSSVIPQVTVDSNLGGYRPASFIDFSREENRKKMAQAIDQETVEKIPFISKEKLNEAVSQTQSGLERWKNCSVEGRSKILLKAADQMEQRRFQFAAWVLKEGGKSWKESDADVVEAIEAIRFAAWEIRRLDQEGFLKNHEPAGVTAVISPWNFPLALPTIGVSSALAVGNPVLLKPAEQTPFVAGKMIELFHDAGVPREILHFVPGEGDIGQALVEHPRVKVIAFTGSEAVGREIDTKARNKKTICEMGGKNAIIVSSTADLDEAVEGTIESAFGHSGQKCSACSRVILHDDIYDEFVWKLVEAAKSLPVAPAQDPAARIVPLIDKEAYERILSYVKRGAEFGKILLDGSQIKSANPCLIGPTIIGDVDPQSELAQKEIFGPVLALIRGGSSLERMVEIANGTRYALTGGAYTRSPVDRKVIMERFQVGNLYINQKITGARIGVQPFGGFKASGTGSKTGGPDYLAQFMTTSEGSKDLPRHPREQLTQVQLPGEVDFLRYEPSENGRFLVRTISVQTQRHGHLERFW